MRRSIKALMVAGSAAALLAFVAPAAGAQPRAASAAAPDFSLSTNYGPANSGPGILFPGETWDPHPWCHDCGTYGGPHYPQLIPGGGCVLDYNFLTVYPFNGFDAPVTLSVSGLPPGVTSRMPRTVMIPAPGWPFEGSFALDASSSVPLGTTFTVKITATSGSLVHTITRPVTVSNQVPAGCDNSTIPWPALRYNEPFGAFFAANEVETVDIILGSPAPAGGTVVTFTSSDPSVVPVPAPVTIPAGLQGAPVQISARQVSKYTPVTFTTSANGNTISTQVDVSPDSEPETVTITQAQFDSSTSELLLFAKDPNYGGIAVLTVLNSSSHQVIGTMNNLGQGDFGAVLPVTAKPSRIRVVSSMTGASATATVK
jgi:hypothetical protein